MIRLLFYGNESLRRSTATSGIRVGAPALSKFVPLYTRSAAVTIMFYAAASMRSGRVYHALLIFSLPADCAVMAVYLRWRSKKDSSVQRPEGLYRDEP